MRKNFGSLTVAEACLSEENAASDALTHPSHSLVYSEYQRLVEALRAIRLESHQSRIALRAHRHKDGRAMNYFTALSKK
jgi:hypothetical protein